MKRQSLQSKRLNNSRVYEQKFLIDSPVNSRPDNSLNSKLWVDFKAKGLPGKWITLRLSSVLERARKLGSIDA